MAAKKKPAEMVTEGGKKQPEVTENKKEKPVVGRMENIVNVNGKMVEIKPTKLKYQRDRTAAFYHVLEIYPLVDIQAMEEGQLDEGRDGDKCLMDWLIAVFDDVDFVIDNYDAMDAEMIEKILGIFKRLNKIDEKEQARKNLTAKREGMR